MRKVLQNGMSFANERRVPAVSLRVRYYSRTACFRRGFVRLRNAFVAGFYRSLYSCLQGEIFL